MNNDNENRYEYNNNSNDNEVIFNIIMLISVIIVNYIEYIL